MSVVVICLLPVVLVSYHMGLRINTDYFGVPKFAESLETVEHNSVAVSCASGNFLLSLMYCDMICD